jgi:hypothetical protein
MYVCMYVCMYVHAMQHIAAAYQHVRNLQCITCHTGIYPVIQPLEHAAKKMLNQIAANVQHVLIL